MNPHRIAIPWFIVIGTLAALVHGGSVWLLHSKLGIPALLSSALGFLLAFPLSFIGHYYLTFASLADKRVAMQRFFTSAMFGFILNSIFYSLLLLFFHHKYPVQLQFVAQVMVSVWTYVVSRLWSFKKL